MSINPDPETTKSSSPEFPTQVKPLHPPWEFSTRRSRIAAPDLDESTHPSPSPATTNPLVPNRTLPRLCACSIAVLLMSSMLFLILLFTAFRVKDPVVSVAGFTTSPQPLRLISRNLTSAGNGTLFADVKVKNSNAAAFRFGVGETAIYYREMVVGEAATPVGKAKARGSVHMRVAVDIIGEKLLGVSRHSEEVKSGTLMMSCITRIPGDVKIFGKKHMVVKVKCGVNYDYVKGELTAGDCIQYIIS
ncbi:hypothetical protein LINPERHAP2_LOCUS33564 [Linum perenne]